MYTDKCIQFELFQLQNTLVPELFSTLLPSSGMLYQQDQGSRFLGSILQTSEIPTCSLNDFAPCVFFFFFVSIMMTFYFREKKKKMLILNIYFYISSFLSVLLSKALVHYCFLVFRRIGEYISLDLFYFVSLTNSCSLIHQCLHVKHTEQSHQSH